MEVEKTPKVGAQGARRGRGESAHEAASGVKQGKGGVFGSAVNKGFRTAAFRFV